MEISTTQRLTPVKPLQVAQFNSGIFISGLDLPEEGLPPLASTGIKYIGKDIFLSVKIAVFLPEDTVDKSLVLQLDENAAAGELHLELHFESKLLDIRDYAVWYVCYDHPVRSAGEITSVHTIAINTVEVDGNPKTKRGTVTQVLES